MNSIYSSADMSLAARLRALTRMEESSEGGPQTAVGAAAWIAEAFEIESAQYVPSPG